MGYHNSSYIEMLHRLIEYVREEAPVALEMGSTQDGVPVFRAKGGGIDSKTDLGGRYQEDTHYDLSERKQALAIWEGNLDALQEFLDHVDTELPEYSFLNTPEKPKSDPIEPVGP